MNKQRKHRSRRAVYLIAACVAAYATLALRATSSGADPVPGVKVERYLDEVQEEAYAKSTMHGSGVVERESRLPIHQVAARPLRTSFRKVERPMISLSGEWLMKDSKPAMPTAGPIQNAFVMPYTNSEGIAAGWFRRGFDRSGWLKVQVPTTVQTGLLKSGELKDPFWNTNTYDELNLFGKPKSWEWNRRQTRIEQKEWWFARKFTVPMSWRGRSIRLYFDGIDYSASVYLNGHPLGHHTGMFGGPSLEITKLVELDRDNELVVRVDRSPKYWTGLLKGSPGFGWHYGHLISTGLWRDVQLQARPTIEIESPYVQTRSITSGQADLRIEYYIRNSGASPQGITVSGSIEGETFHSAPLHFENDFVAPPGESRYQTEVRLSDTHLWWPLNYGKQDLYRLDISLRSDGGAFSDGTSTVFGVRTIEMRPVPGVTKPETDYRWQFVINGQPIFIKGANWCWSDPMLQLGKAKYDRLLELAMRAGIQMFRVWGGGIIETDEFYNQCDRRGIMVYQEFPLCWGPFDFPLTDAHVIDDQVSRVVKRLRNHPALIMWGGGNENRKPLGADEALSLVGRRCRQYDPSRPFHRTDPWGGSSHNWIVYHGGAAIDRGYQEYSTVFQGEFGLPSMTDRRSSLRYLPEAALQQWPPDQSSHGIIAHMQQFSLRDLFKTMRYADYGPIRDWATYMEYSQMAQGDALRFGAELQRASSNSTKTGFWFYKFTDLFPGHAWAVVDFYGEPKLAYYRAKQVCRPRNAFATYSRFDWTPGEEFHAVLHVANDTPQALENVTVRATIFGSDLSQLWGKDYQVADVQPNGRRDLDRIGVVLDPTRVKPFLLRVSMRELGGKLLSDQWYWFNFKKKTTHIEKLEKLPASTFPESRLPEAFAAYAEQRDAPLLRFPKTQLVVERKFAGNHGVFTIRNVGSVPAFNILIENFPNGWNDFLDDNSFSLGAGESREVGFELEAGESVDSVTIKAWNASAVKVQ